MQNYLILLCKFSGESNPVRLFAYLLNKTTNIRFGCPNVFHSLFTGTMAIFACLFVAPFNKTCTKEGVIVGHSDFINRWKEVPHLTELASKILRCKICFCA